MEKKFFLFIFLLFLGILILIWGQTLILSRKKISPPLVPSQLEEKPQEVTIEEALEKATAKEFREEEIFKDFEELSEKITPQNPKANIKQEEIDEALKKLTPTQQ